MAELTTESPGASDEAVLMELAHIHNGCPKAWNPDHCYSEQDLARTLTELKKDVSRPGSVILVRDSHREIVGFHWARLREASLPRVAYLMSLWVHPDYRGHGIATGLKRRMEQWLIEQGVAEVRTDVHIANERMLELNQKLGFEPVVMGMSKTIG